jgi:hypothetical protein
LYGRIWNGLYNCGWISSKYGVIVHVNPQAPPYTPLKSHSLPHCAVNGALGIGDEGRRGGAIATYRGDLDNDATTSPNALNRFQLPKCPTAYETNLKALLNRF